MAELNSPTAVEQILGRVLRKPRARRKTRDMLNRAYAFVASSSFQTVAERLKDGLVDSACFNRLEAELLARQHCAFEFEDERADFIHKSDALPHASSVSAGAAVAAIAKLSPYLRSHIHRGSPKIEVI